MSEKLKREYEVSRKSDELPKNCFQCNDGEYVEWLESQLEQSRADKAELLEFIIDIMSGNFEYMEPERRYEELLKKHRE